jgi:P4 family phage/plasmid primase-like protien
MADILYLNQNYKLDDLLDELVQLKKDYAIILAHRFIVGNNTGCKYYAFENFDNAIKHIENKPEKCLNEVIFGDQPQKIKFDIDCKEPYDKKKFLEVITSLIKKVLTQVYNNIKEPELIILDASGGEKLSFHIILKNYYVNNVSQAKYIAGLVKREVAMDNQYSQEVVDLAVYNSKQQFRVANSPTIKGDRPLVITTGECYEDTLITLISGDEELLPDIYQQPAGSPKELPANYMEIINKYVPKEYLEGFKFRNEESGYINYQRVRSTFCKICNKTHDNENIFIYKHQHTLRVCCRRASANNLNPYYIEISMLDPNMDFIRKCIQLKDNHDLSDIFISKMKDDIFYNIESNKIFVFDYDKCLWIDQNHIYINGMIMDIISSQMYVLHDYLDEQLKNPLINQQEVYAEQKSIISAVKTFKQTSGNNVKARVREILAISYKNQHDLLNIQHHLLPLKNKKVFNMQTGLLRERTKEDYFSFECNFSYKQQIDPIIPKYILDLTKNRPELVNFLQVALGYSITGETDEKCCFIFYGPKGGNGKTKFLNLIYAIIGNSFSGYASNGVFIKNPMDKGNANAHTSHLMSVINRRLLFILETSENDVINDSCVKKLTGDDYIQIRGLNKEEKTYKPFCKIIVATNNIPKINITDPAMINRIKFVPFDAEFVTEPINGQYLAVKDFEANLSENYLDDLGSWLLQGAVLWYRDKRLPQTDIINEMKNIILHDMDTVKQYIDARIEPSPGDNIRSKELFDNYVIFCENNGLKPENDRGFAKIATTKLNRKEIRGINTYKNIRYKIMNEEAI